MFRGEKVLANYHSIYIWVNQNICNMVGVELNKLPEMVEKAMPSEIKAIRKFYFECLNDSQDSGCSISDKVAKAGGNENGGKGESERQEV